MYEYIHINIIINVNVIVVVIALSRNQKILFFKFLLTHITKGNLKFPSFAVYIHKYVCNNVYFNVYVDMCVRFKYKNK